LNIRDDFLARRNILAANQIARRTTEPFENNIKRSQGRLGEGGPLISKIPFRYLPGFLKTILLGLGVGTGMSFVVQSRQYQNCQESFFFSSLFPSFSFSLSFGFEAIWSRSALASASFQ